MSDVRRPAVYVAGGPLPAACPRSRVVCGGMRLKGGASDQFAALYGLVIGTLLSGFRFAVEVITAWPGLGRLMLDRAFRARRDVSPGGGAARAAGFACFLAAGTLMFKDAALALVDPSGA